MFAKLLGKNAVLSRPYFKCRSVYWVIVTDFLESEPRGMHSRLKIAYIPPRHVPPSTSWGCQLFTFHLNYVAGCTDPLLFLFERTFNYYVDNQWLVPW